MNRILPLSLWLSLFLLDSGPCFLPEAVEAFQAKKDNQPLPALTNSIGMKLVQVPAGEFFMGSADADPDALPDEKPRHKVKITRPFYMGVYEVTQEEFEKVLGIKGSFFSPHGHGKNKVKGLNTRRFPAEQVRWFQAVEFCRKLSELPEEKKAGRVYRLPTEAQWEYACRAGTQTAFAFGDSLSSLQANFNGNHPFGKAKKGPFLIRTAEVGSYAANAFGLHDMHGNVWEWCADWYGSQYYKESPLEDPSGPKSGSMRVIRGGEWYADGRDCRSAFRYAELPGGTFYVMGFRVVMTHSQDGSDPLPNPEEKPAGPMVVQGESRVDFSRGEDWPRWRGPRGDGSWKGPNLLEKFPKAGLPVLWRQEIGGGYAGIVVGQGRLYVTDFLPDQPEKIEPNPDKGTLAGPGTERILCFEAATGKLLWRHDDRVNYKGLAYASGPRATPTLADGRLYTVGAMGNFHCLDAATGKVFWSKDLVREEKAPLPGWGFAAAPVLFEDLVILHTGTSPLDKEDAGSSYRAFERKTGREVWRSVPDGAGYATPVLADCHGQTQLVCWTPNHIRALEPRSGKLLWSIPFEVTYSTAIATPVCRDGIVLVTSYYEGSKAIQVGEKPGEAKVLWHDRLNLRGLMSQPLYRDGLVFILDRRHGLTCVDWKTGKKIWDDGHQVTPKGRNPQATMVWLGNDDRALILNSDGELILAHMNRAGYHELDRVKILGPTWAHPAYAGNCVFVRNDRELVCVLLSP